MRLLPWSDLCGEVTSASVFSTVDGTGLEFDCCWTGVRVLGFVAGLGLRAWNLLSLFTAVVIVNFLVLLFFAAVDEIEGEEKERGNAENMIADSDIGARVDSAIPLVLTEEEEEDDEEDEEEEDEEEETAGCLGNGV
jgi:hypothetical protein